MFVYLYVKPVLGGMPDVRLRDCIRWWILPGQRTAWFFMIWLLINLPVALIVSYVIETFVSYVLSGLIIGKILG